MRHVRFFLVRAAAPLPRRAPSMTLLVTGGAGFIGSQFVLDWLAGGDETLVNLDSLTYAGSLSSLQPVLQDPRHRFVQGDIADAPLLDRLLAEHRPRAVVHFAAESHVDRSITDPGAFVRTNVGGTLVLLEAVRRHWAGLDGPARARFRFLQVGTDEVYGSLAPDDPPVTEQAPVRPNNPYSASKAAADHLVRAWHHNYGLPTLTVRSANNYGPRQFPEKLIPLTLVRALAGQPVPLYGSGLQQRDWLFVRDHCAALRAVLEGGTPGEVYNAGTGRSRSNLEVVTRVCALLDAVRPDPAGPHARLIAHVADRPGHDQRYAMDAGRLARELGWRPQVELDAGLRETVAWYLDQPGWVAEALARAPRRAPAAP